MAFRRRKKEKVRFPNGKDAINLRKLLFLPPEETHNSLTLAEWNRIDFRCLQSMKPKFLRAACIARKLDKKGKKRILVERLQDSFMIQKESEQEEFRLKQEEAERYKDTLGGVWTCGSGFSGQLGHGDIQPCLQPTQIKCLRGKGVYKVSAGFDSDVVFALTKSGDVFTWGNRLGPTGIRKNISRAELMKYSVDDELANIDGNQSSSSDYDDEIDDIDVEDILSPVRVESLCGEEINFIAVGRVHCAAMTRGGDVFTWGHNDHAQLGNEPAHNLSELQWKKSKVRHGLDSSVPQIWNQTIPNDCIIKNVSVGTDHTMVVSSLNKIYSFGATFDTSEQSILTRNLEKLNIKEVSCGALHAGVLTDNGQVYTWGSGDGSRLGHGDNTSYATPKLIESLKKEIVFSLSCACWHSAVIILVPPLIKGGYIYSWGSGRLGQLGQGGVQISPYPALVKDLLLTHVVVKQLSCGMYHNAVLSADDEVYTWGSNVNSCLGRPNELQGLEEDFCAVPGPVENMKNFVGRACSVACGREFTVIATKPYLGPSKKEKEENDQLNAKKAESLARQELREEKAWEEREKAIELRKINYGAKYLNQYYPKCAHCDLDSFCPGFQPGEVRPSSCKHCLHDKRKHTYVHMTADKKVTLEYILELASRLEIELNFSPFETINGEELSENEVLK